jgi:hypothetical protein
MVVGLIWNTRGLNRPDKLPRVHELIRDTCPNLIIFLNQRKLSFLGLRFSLLTIIMCTPGIGFLQLALLVVY